MGERGTVVRCRAALGSTRRRGPASRRRSTASCEGDRLWIGGDVSFCELALHAAMVPAEHFAGYYRGVELRKKDEGWREFVKAVKEGGSASGHR